MKKKTSPIRVAIVGTGGMANVHAERFKSISGCEVVAGCDVDPERARVFCERHEIPNAFDSLDKMLASGRVDAVSVVTPDAFHSPVSLACMKAGKHVLCEKPLAVDYPQAKKMLAAAKKAGVINMVNFSYRDWPCIQAAAASIRRGELGEIRHVEASYLQAWLASTVWGDWTNNPAWLWRLSTAHGSKGALGDVGVHILDYATYPVGPIREVNCRLKAFHKAPKDRIGEYKLDANDSAVMHVEFANGALGVIHTTRWAGGHQNRLYLKICGTKGSIDMDSERSTKSYRECRGDGFHKAEWRDVECQPVPNNYERFIRAIRTGKPGEPDFARGAEIQRILDACFVSEQERRAVRI
ncbi:MAG: Gfo/Idh/MocA family oxidoreductase [Terrimicrobiaceae bacterium]|nr:Gfo/Idh/MocA family oxidoreductase [Terrimicrobiaceae bacterium]